MTKEIIFVLVFYGILILDALPAILAAGKKNKNKK